MLDSIRQDKINKMQNFLNVGINPYPAGPFEKENSQEVLEKEIGIKAKVAGRVMLFRDMGNITFIHIQDQFGRIQVVLNKKEFDGDYKLWVKNLDSGDFIGVEGERFDTRKGEKSVLIKNLTLLSKSVLPLPDKHKALQNEEEKFRKRYLDILFNDEVRDMVIKRDKFWNAVRTFLKERQFIEVETPVLETTVGGADASPFETHHKALDLDVYLRISMGELWQKKLMVAGLEKTFEIGRQFRNEGMDSEHLQDYTQMEFYLAYANFEKGMELVKELYRYIATETFGTTKFSIRGFEIDLSEKWKIYDYRDTIKKETGIDILKTDLVQIEIKLKELGIKYNRKGLNFGRGIDNLWKICRKKIGGPGFLVGVPVSVSPLAKRVEDQPELTQRFQPIIAGSELGNGYSELNDPIDQAKRFKEQQKLRDAGDDEAQMHDEDFIEALEYGMPPTCGFGMSERVFSFLMDKTARECQIFPLMKPKTKQSNSEKSKKIEDNENQELGIDYKQARELLNFQIKDEITKLHMIETEAIMKNLAKRFGVDSEKWGIIGLLHDIDWELTKDETSKHCVVCVDILKEAGGSEFLIEKVVSHCYGFEGNSDLKNKERTGNLEHSLAAAETLTGLIIASALMQPDKKLKSVKLSSLRKKFKNKKFAERCNREIILECEKIGIPIDEFLEIGLKSLQGIADEISM